MKKILSLVWCLLLIACSSTNDMGCVVKDSNTLMFADKYSEVIDGAGFDTYLQLTIFTNSKDKFQEYYDLACNDWIYYGQLFDIYHNYDNLNNLKTINDNAGVSPVKVDQDLLELLLLAKEYYDITNGAFDITMGSVLSVWHKYREEGIKLNNAGKSGELPSNDELEKAASNSGFEYVEIDEEEGTVYLTKAGVLLDVGGIAKGYAAEKIALKLECAGVVSGFVNAGGNIRTIGSNKENLAWSFALVSPNEPSNVLETLNYSKQVSIVTSGDYLRYYEVDGKRYAHIISPTTLYPATNFRAVSVACTSSAVADILSTTFFVLSYEEGIKLANELGIAVIWMVDEINFIKADNYKISGGIELIYSDEAAKQLLMNN